MIRRTQTDDSRVKTVTLPQKAYLYRKREPEHSCCNITHAHAHTHTAVAAMSDIFKNKMIHSWLHI